MTIWGLLLLSALVMKVWPETRCALWLCDTLMDRPLAFLSRIRRRHLIFLIVGIATIYSFSLAGMPHLGIIAAVDLSAYVDIIISATMIAALNRSRGAWTATLARLPRLRRTTFRPRQRRTRSTVRPTPSNDDDRHGVLALAA